MRLLLLIASLVCASAQDIFVPFFEAAAAAPGQNNLLTSLIAFYRFEENADVTAQDSSPADLDLTTSGTPPNPLQVVIPDGMVGNTKQYKGGQTSGDDTDYYKRSDAPTSPFAFAGDFTIAGWIKQEGWSFTDPQPHYTVASLGPWGTGHFSWLVSFDIVSALAVKMSFYWSTTGASVSSLISSAVGVDVNWHFFYVKRQGGILYISNTEESSSVLSDPTPAVITTLPLFTENPQELQVGNLAALSNNDFKGYIDELGFWNRALTPCELQWLYSAKNHVFTYTAPFDNGPCATYTAYAQVYDSFSYSDATNLGDQTGWSAVNGTMSLSGGKVYSNTATTHTGVRRTTPAFGANQRSWVTLNWPGPGFNGPVGPAVRMQAGSADWYGLFWDPNGLTLYLFTVVGGSFTAIQSVSKTYATGNKLRLSVTGTGASIRLSADEDTGSGWVNVWANQTVPTILNSGQPGVHGFNNIGAAGLSATEWFAEEF